MIKRAAAAATLLAILIGLPLTLITLGADPLAWPSWATIRSAITTPDDGTLILGILKGAAWLIWAALAVSIVIEAVARVRGREAAPAVTGLRLPQSIARALFGALVVSAVALPGAAHAAPAAPAVSVSAVAVPAAAAPAVATAEPVPADPATAATTGAGTRSHTVVRGDTLSRLAQRYLGDWRRFPELARLNADILGGKPDFLRPGWTLRIPAPDSPPPATYLVKRGDTLRGVAAALLGDADRYIEIAQASKATIQPDGARLTDVDDIRPGWTLTIPSDTLPTPDTAAEQDPSPAPQDTPTPTHPAGHDPAATPDAATPQHPVPSTPAPAPTVAESPAPVSAPAAAPTVDVGDDSPWAPVIPAGVGVVLAAGVVTLLTRRRTDQQRRRRPGQRLPHPAAAAERLERSLRAGADPLDYVDIALRGIAATTTGHILPIVRAARVTPTALDLYLEAPATLPAPWVDTAASTVWTVPLTALPEAAPAAPAPYPSLVSLGRDDEDGHVLLDLETIAGLAITGPEDRARDIQAALAVELATSAWADDVRVTMVGACADLEDALQTGRIRYLPALDRLLDELERRATSDRAAIEDAGAASLQQARAQDLARDAWTPEIVIPATPLTPAHTQRVTELLTGKPRVAIAAITRTPVTDWVLQLDATDPTRATLAPIGLTLRPQYLPPESYRALLEVVDLASDDTLVTVEEPAGDEPTLIDVPDTPESLTTAVVLSPAPHPSGLPTLPALSDASAPTQPAAAADPHDTTTAVAADEAAPAVAELTPVPTDPDTDHPDTDSTDGHDEGLGPVRISVLGPITLTGARGTAEKSRVARLTELAVYLALHPGASHLDIDDAIWPNRRSDDNTATRHPVATRLRNWLGTADDGGEFFPRHQGSDTGYVLHDVHTDVEEWDRLIEGRPLRASSDNLTAALALVRGRPFGGQRIRYYGWADRIKQRLISEIVDASYELGRRRYLSGEYRACEQAVTIGLEIDPGQERLHRLRILACHDAHDVTSRQEAIAQLVATAEDLDCPLEPETEDLLAALADPARISDVRDAI